MIRRRLAFLLVPIASAIACAAGCAADPEGAPPTDVTVDPQAVTDLPEVAYPNILGEDVAVSLPFAGGTLETTARLIDDDRMVIEGDVVLSRRLLDARATGVVLGLRWPTATIPWDTDATLAGDARVTNAIAQWTSLTNITFRAKTAADTSYLHFQSAVVGTGCFADHIGYRAGANNITLEPGCSQGNALHEIGHVMGLSHEQNRTDRDSFLKVDVTQIIAGKASQFDKIDGTNLYNVSTFDFGSVMMYGSGAFAIGATPTMTKLDGSTWAGQRATLSDIDRGSIWSMYDPTGIHAKWDALGGSSGAAGWPVTGEFGTPDGIGSYVHFQNGWSIYYSPSSGIHEVHGSIRGKWQALGWERSLLGYPTTDETGTPDGIGRYNHFQGGSIYWTLATGAHEVHGAIRNYWQAGGWERGFNGYPTSDETVSSDGVMRFNTFQHGTVYWTAANGAHSVQNEILTAYQKNQALIGYPTSEEIWDGGQTSHQNFTCATITDVNRATTTTYTCLTIVPRKPLPL